MINIFSKYFNNLQKSRLFAGSYFVRLCIITAFVAAAISTITLFPNNAHALSATQKKHTQKTFEYVKKRKWDKALATSRKIGNKHIEKAFRWHYIAYSSDPAPFEVIYEFIKQNPHFPLQERLLKRAEMSLMYNAPHDEYLLKKHLSLHKPVTWWAKLREMEVGIKPVSASLIKEAWENGSFSAAEEKRIAKQYSNTLRKNNHNRRIDNLLWDGKISAAKRMIHLASKDHRKLASARIALQKRVRSGITRKINAIPKHLQKDDGIMFDRMVYRFKSKNYTGVEEILLAQRKAPKHSDKWWKYRKYVIREAISNKNYNLAERLADKHWQNQRFELSEALWLKGWIALSFKNKPRKALSAFSKLYENVGYPISLARGSYWAGKAAYKSGNDKISQQWLNIAAKYNTTFYGQLAHEEIYGHQPLKLAKHPKFTSKEFNHFAHKNELAQLVNMLALADVNTPAWPFIRHLVEQASTEDTPAKNMAMLAYLCSKTGRPDLAIKVSKEAVKYGYFLQKSSYPITNVPRNIATEPELSFAIMRQESSFLPTARSHVGATGMMQLMPATAKLTARKHNMKYSKSKLHDPKYNITLGSLYLAELLDKFDGSYVKSIAGYNAGPSRPIRWAKEREYNTETIDDILNWIESIPFSETRNYVMRVLENHQLYRNILSGGEDYPNLSEILLR